MRTLARKFALGNLDTFKDIWGPGRCTICPHCFCEFRYLQGYMGTVMILNSSGVLKRFRYLQGYMGTRPITQATRKPIIFRYLQGYMGTPKRLPPVFYLAFI